MEHPVKSNKANAVTDVTDHFDINVTRAHARARGDITKQPVTSVTPDTRSLGPAPANCTLRRKSPPPYETEAIKRYGWRDQGILVVSAEDQRLTWPERELVRQLGSKLYGRTPREGR
jgi:hypothetical protein